MKILIGEFHFIKIILFTVLVVTIVTNLDSIQSKVNYLFDNRAKLVYEEFVPTNFLNSSYEELPVINISLSHKNLTFLTNVRDKAILKTGEMYSRNGGYISPDDGNKYTKKTKTTMTHKGEKYSIKIKLHGTDNPHFRDKKRSYSIKLKKNKLFDYMREFALIIPDQQNVSSILLYSMVQKYMGIDVKSKLVRLTLNGIDQGVYILEEKLSKELLERSGLSGIDVVQLSKRWTSQYEDPHSNPFSNNLSHLKIKNFSKIDNGQLLMYKKMHSLKTYKKLKNIVDIDQFARYSAINMIFGQRKTGDNIKFLYNNATGKFSPSYYRSEGGIGILEQFQSESSYTYEKIVENVSPFDVLIKSNEFRSLRNSYLYKIIKDEEKLLSFMDSLVSKFINIINFDTSNNILRIGYIEKVNLVRKTLFKNIQAIKKYLYYGRVYSVFEEKDSRNYTLEISPDVNSFINIESINFGVNNPDNYSVTIKNISEGTEETMIMSNIENYFMEKRFIIGLDDKFDLRPITYKYQLSFNKDIEINNFNVKFINNVTMRMINSRDNYVESFIRPKNFSFDGDINEIGNLYPNIQYRDNVIVFTRGLYEVKDNLIMPFGYDVIFEKGVNIKIAKNKSILIYGGIEINGTKKDPVIISSLDLQKNFSSVIVVGDKNTSVSKINYLNIFGGGDGHINGIFASGALSLYDQKNVFIKNSKIYANVADDGLNIKNSMVFLQGNSFLGNFSDQVDLDNCTGRVENNIFSSEHNSDDVESAGSNKNGDGLDISYSRVFIDNNTFVGFLDKGISVGEKSNALVSNNKFLNNRSAITAKDQSSVFLYLNKYKNNKFNIEMYQKKNIFQAPSVFNINDNFSKNSIKKTSNSLYFKLPISHIPHENPNDFRLLKSLDWKEYE